jgi:hypothetical protein
MTIRFGENSIETLACLIIDDPLIKPRYGCLDYSMLLQEMKEHSFFSEIAFIPWNYKRSHAKTVRLFAENPAYFGICVHGCNHTGNEFGQGDYQALSALSSNALWCMEQHMKITGLPFDPVMVFPQGRFSSTAMQALKDQGYQAAFNSTLQSTDICEVPQNEYLQPATTFYHDFPLFLRRYPKDKSLFIQDIACGRPIIIVEHPGAFKNGYKEITDLVDWINGLGNIKWKSLEAIAEYYCRNKPTFTRKSSRPLPSNLRFDVKVALRRYLSELRDDYIEPSDYLNNLYMKVRNLAKR